MESSTKILRRMLDERGVEYDTDDEDGCEFTEWVANGLEWEADSRGELVSLMPVMLITPAQAIAATLGATDARPTQAESSETCRIKPWKMERDTGFYDCMECSECGYVTDVSEWAKATYCAGCGRRVEQ